MRLITLLFVSAFSLTSFAANATLNKDLTGRCERLAKKLVHIAAMQRNKHCFNSAQRASKDVYAAKMYLEVPMNQAASIQLNNAKNWIDDAVSRNCRHLNDFVNAQQETLNILNLIQ